MFCHALFCHAMFRHALFRHTMFCQAMFCHALFCHALLRSVLFVEGEGGGHPGTRWSGASGGRGMQGGVGREVCP